MRQTGSEALDWGYAPYGAGQAAPVAREPRPAFEVVPGGGLDAKVRQGVSPVFVARVRAVVLAAALLIALGGARVAITVATVTQLQVKSSLKTQVEEAQTLCDELKVERSVLSSNTRISRIATQNLGMVLASSHVEVDVSEDGGEAATEAAEAAAAEKAAAEAAAESSEATAETAQDAEATAETAQDAEATAETSEAAETAETAEADAADGDVAQSEEAPADDASLG